MVDGVIVTCKPNVLIWPFTKMFANPSGPTQFKFELKLRKTEKKFFLILFIFRERGREGERDGEKHQCVVASHVPTNGDTACMQSRHVP